MVSKVTLAVVLMAALLQITYCHASDWSEHWHSGGDDSSVSDEIREHQENVEAHEAALEAKDNDDGEVVSHSNSYSWSVDEDGKKTEKHEGHVVRKNKDGEIVEEHYKH